MNYYYSGEEMPCKRYYIDYGTGAGNEEVTGTIAEAMRVADEGAAYTQCDIKIYLADQFEKMGCEALPVAVRRWCGVSFDPDDEENRYITADDVIEFGYFGYYCAWRVREDDDEWAEAEHENRYDWQTYTHEMYMESVVNKE